MKARIIETGEIVYGHMLEKAFIATWKDNGNKAYSKDEVEVIPDVRRIITFPDWEKFRNETAAKILIALLANPSITQMDKDLAPMEAVICTDELINQLKKMKE